MPTVAVCPGCGKEYWTYPCYIKRNIHYCSRECKRLYGIEKRRARCATCNEPLTHDRYRIKNHGSYCSEECWMPVWANLYFWPRVHQTASCWEWNGLLTPLGYGATSLNTPRLRKFYLAHRFSYILHHGSIPHDSPLDHLCRNTRCVNPEHLDPVSQAVNLERARPYMKQIGRAKQTHCGRGHPFDQENTALRKDGVRRCKTCLAFYARDSYWRKQGYRDHADLLSRESDGIFMPPAFPLGGSPHA